jgi:hypothetical protein
MKRQIFLITLILILLLSGCASASNPLQPATVTPGVVPRLDPSPTPSGVSMQARSAMRAGCGRARFWICSVCSVNGHAYPGTLREGLAETCMRMAFERQSSFGCLAAPFAFAKLGMAKKRHSPHL